MKLYVYQYPITNPKTNETYYGSYSIKEGVEPAHKPNEELVQIVDLNNHKNTKHFTSFK